MAAIRYVTYELKLGNLGHLLYKLKNGRLAEGVSMQRVLEIPLRGCNPVEIEYMNERFLDLHFGNIFYNLPTLGHPKNDLRKSQLYSDIFGRTQNKSQKKSRGESYRKEFIDVVVNTESLADGELSAIEELYKVNRDILSKWNRDLFYPGVSAFVKEIEKAEAAEMYDPLESADLEILLDMVNEDLNRKTLDGDAVALTWLLLGAFLRHHTIELIKRVEPDRYLRYHKEMESKSPDIVREDLPTEPLPQSREIAEEGENASEFQKLIDSFDASMKTGYKGFYFKNMEFACHGRENEKTILKQFLVQEENFISWLAVTGKSGVGKSKLLYNYIMSNKDQNWKMVMLETKSIQQILQCKDWKYPKNLLIVFDYAEEAAKEIGRWMYSLNADNTQNQIRVILIARDFILRENGEYANVTWYDDLLGMHEQRQYIEAIRYQFESRYKSIHIEGASEPIGINIIRDYILKHDRENIGKYDLKEIYDAAARIDTSVTFPRPAIILFTVDAYIKRKDPRKWDLEQLTQYVTNDILDYLKNDLFKNDPPNVNDEMVKLLLYATCTGKLDIEAETDISPYFARARETFLKFPETRKQQILQSMNCCIQSPYFLYPLEPDLVGEKFVLDSFLKLYNQDRIHNVAGNLLNSHPENFSRCVIRCISDYYHATGYQELFNNAMRNWKIDYNKLSRDAAIAWLQVLLSLIYYAKDEARISQIRVDIKKLTDLIGENLIDILMSTRRI